MYIYLKRSISGDFMTSFLRMDLDEEEISKVQSLRLHNCKINQKGSSVLTAINSITANTFAQQTGSIRNRWQTAVTRTTGYVLLDVLILIPKAIFRIITFIFRLFFGTNLRFKDLQRGIKISATSVEALREKETNVITSLSAVHRAMEMMDFETEFEFKGIEYLNEVPGLKFTGDISNAALGNTDLASIIENALQDEADEEDEVAEAEAEEELEMDSAEVS